MPCILRCFIHFYGTNKDRQNAMQLFRCATQKKNKAKTNRIAQKAILTRKTIFLHGFTEEHTRDDTTATKSTRLARLALRTMRIGLNRTEQNKKEVIEFCISLCYVKLQIATYCMLIELFILCQRFFPNRFNVHENKQIPPHKIWLAISVSF